MSIEAKIREASNEVVVHGHCLTCKIRNICKETENYTGMNFCENTADEIINKINDSDEVKQ